MATRHGKNSTILLGGYDLSTSLRTAGIPRSIDTAETTAFKSTNKSYVIGLPDGSITLEGMFAYDNTTKEIAEIVEDYAAQETAIPVMINLGGAITAGAAVHAAVAYETSINYSGSHTDIVGLSLNLQCSGSIGSSIALSNPSTAVTLSGSSTNGTGVDYSGLLVGSNTDFPNGGTVALQVLENSVDDTTTIVAQSSPDGSTWTDIGDSIDVATDTVGGWFTTDTAAVDDSIRWSITAAGSGDIKFVACFIPSQSS
jgi:hypothetical protein